jgi:hypothetical protein
LSGEGVRGEEDGERLVGALILVMDNGGDDGVAFESVSADELEDDDGWDDSCVLMTSFLMSVLNCLGTCEEGYIYLDGLNDQYPRCR